MLVVGESKIDKSEDNEHDELEFEAKLVIILPGLVFDEVDESHYNLIQLTQICNGDDDLGNREHESEKVKREFAEDLVGDQRDGSTIIENDTLEMSVF